MSIVPFGFIFLAPLAEYNSSMPFVIIQIIGTTVFYGMLFYVAFKMKSIPSLILVVISYICLLGMGYLSSKFQNAELAKWNWIAEVVNIVSQGSLLGAMYILHRKGLVNFKLERGKKI